ncbi:MAG: phosphonate ABC transporter substrate-binding protein [Pseudomonadota bacterium]
MRRRHLLAAGIAAIAAMPLAAAQAEELAFGVISTESSTNLKADWEPFLADMGKAIGMPVRGFYATDYASVVEAMRFNKVQLAWFGNASAIQAVDRADGEVFVQSVSVDGNAGYWSLLITHQDSAIHSLDDILKSPGKYTFGNGDPNSTSGFLIPGYYVFAKNNIDPRKHFTRMLTANHETNMLAVVNKQVDVATNNTEELERFTTHNPDKAKLIRVIWKSPLIPLDPILWRKDLPAEVKQKVKAFMVSYGVSGPDAEHGRAVLAKLRWAPFKESSNNQLLPVRQVALYRDKLKIQDDANLAADDKAARVAEIDGKLAALAREMDQAGVKTN